MCENVQARPLNSFFIVPAAFFPPFYHQLGKIQTIQMIINPESTQTNKIYIDHYLWDLIRSPFGLPYSTNPRIINTWPPKEVLQRYGTSQGGHPQKPSVHLHKLQRTALWKLLDCLVMSVNFIPLKAFLLGKSLRNSQCIHFMFNLCETNYIYVRVRAFISSTEFQSMIVWSFIMFRPNYLPKRQVKPALHDVVMNGPCEENWFLPNITSEFELFICWCQKIRGEIRSVFNILKSWEPKGTPPMPPPPQEIRPY